MTKEIPKDFYITSDTWFGRPQILQIANRKFKDVEEMNSTLIKNWNKKRSDGPSRSKFFI